MIYFKVLKAFRHFVTLNDFAVSSGKEKTPKNDEPAVETLILTVSIND